jgi:hypothetical protein
MGAVDTARDNATLREEFLRRGLSTRQELDRLGWVSHSDLDLWEEAGVLELGLAGIQEAWGLGLLSGDIFNRRILRARGGRFAGVVGGPEAKQSERRIKRNIGPRIERQQLRPLAPGEKIHRPERQRVGAPIGSQSLADMRRREGERAANVASIRAGMPPEVIAKLKGKRGGVKGKSLNVYATPGKAGPEVKHVEGRPERMSSAQYAREVTPHAELHKAGRTRLERLAKEERLAGVKAARSGDHEKAAQHHAQAADYTKAAGDPAQTRVHGQKELYAKRSKTLEKRIQRNVAKAGERITPAAGGTRSEHELSAAEAHFNDAGRVSQKTLLAYAEEAARNPTTAEMYRDKNGNYHPSRAALHADIIDKLLRQHEQTAEGKDAGLSGAKPYLEPPKDGKPTVIFTGGGYASGKGSVVGKLKSEGNWPNDALLLDPDLIKAELPEFQLAAMNDPEANLRVYSEAWDIAQEAMKQAQDRKLNVVVDGITDTGADEVAQRVKSFTDKGYVNPKIFYVSVPTDEAIRRAQDRAAKGNTPADRRMIPEVIMRSVHRDVSATIPGVMAKAREMGAEVHVFDTNQGKDALTGENNPALRVAHAAPNGQIHLDNSAGYQSILNKAQESIKGVPDVSVAPTGVWKTGGQDVTIRPEAERTVGRAVMNGLPKGSEVKLPQPVGGPNDPGELMRLAETKGLPAYQKLLDLGRGVIAQLGGQTQDISEGKDFKQVGQDIQNNMDQPHVIIAPVKSMKRALEKAASDGTPNDLTQLHDAVRATVTVPTAQDLPTAIAAITKEAEAQGWKVERVKARLVNAQGSNRAPTNGYGDTSLILRGPREAGGLTAELQINTNPMWWTKEIGPGHGYYELERQISGRATAEGRKETPQEKALVTEIQAAAKPLYDRAWGASLNGGATANVRNVVMGDATEQARAQKELSDLQAKTHALMGSAPTPTTQRGRRPRAA